MPMLEEHYLVLVEYKEMNMIGVAKPLGFNLIGMKGKVHLFLVS